MGKGKKAEGGKCSSSEKNFSRGLDRSGDGRQDRYPVQCRFGFHKF